jgi:glycosyltransferase involved in cell wall biosynthesis
VTPRVTIDATSTLFRSAGVKNYTYHWVRHLQRISASVRAFPFLADFGGLDHQHSALPAWRTIPRLAAVASMNRLGIPPLDSMLEGAQVFHASNQIRRAPRRAKLTATVHDLTTILMPEVHTAANIRADQSYAETILRRADGLIAVSENTRQDAIRLLGIAPERITTIHSGVADEFFDAKPAPRARPYVLFVGAIEPRKNLDTLLDAWRELRPNLRAEFDLVIAGATGWGADTTLARIRSEAVYAGYVPEPDLPGLVAGATLFVYPSLYEGFGFPVAQAMAAGVAVVTSNNSCLPEITGGAARLVDPSSTSGIAEGIEDLLDSPERRDALRRPARERAELYRWTGCAQRSIEFFRRVAGS